jgi:glutamine amidotransferase
MRRALRQGLPTIGICLGMQLLFDGSDESEGTGLGVIPGRVRRLQTLRNPHMGWNTFDQGTDADPLLRTSRLRTAYYANGYVCDPVDASVASAWSTHDGVRFPAIVRSGSMVGVQFHPEKSSAAGVRFLRAFIEETRR